MYRKYLCGRCFSATQRLARIESWNLDDPASLVGYPQGSVFRQLEYFPFIRKEAISQARGRLSEIKSGEEMWVTGASGLIIERLLCRIAAKCGCRHRVHDNAATRIDHGFDPKEKRELFRLLHEIEEDLPWPGINFPRIFLSYERALERKRANKMSEPKPSDVTHR